jgi:hypothetical protein
MNETTLLHASKDQAQLQEVLRSVSPVSAFASDVGELAVSTEELHSGDISSKALQWVHRPEQQGSIPFSEEEKKRFRALGY